jgi:hypothetical protein
MSLERHPPGNMIFSKDAPDSTKSISAPTRNVWLKNRVLATEKEV